MKPVLMKWAGYSAGDMRCFIMMLKHLSIRAGLMNILILA